MPQLQAKITTSILRFSKSELGILPLNLRKNNWALNSLFLAYCMQVKFDQDHRDILSWSINGGILPIRQVLMAQHADNLIPSIPKSDHFPLFFMDQLLWTDRSVVSWTHYRYISHLKCQGKQAKWFLTVIEYVRSASPLLISSLQISPTTSFYNF